VIRQVLPLVEYEERCGTNNVEEIDWIRTTRTASLRILAHGLKEFTCHLAAVKVGLATGGANDTGMCQRFCIGGEKSRLTPPDCNYTPKTSTVRTLHRGTPSPLEKHSPSGPSQHNCHSYRALLPGDGCIASLIFWWPSM